MSYNRYNYTNLQNYNTFRVRSNLEASKVARGFGDCRISSLFPLFLVEGCKISSLELYFGVESENWLVFGGVYKCVEFGFSLSRKLRAVE